MIPTQVAVALKSPLLCRFVGFNRGSVFRFGLQSQLVANPARNRGNEAWSFSRCPSYALKFCSGIELKESCHLELRNRPVGREQSRVLAVADGGSGGTGGYGGSDGTGGYGGSRGENPGGGDGKGSDGSSGGNNWSFLSWYLALLAKHPVTVKAVTSALLTCIGDLICQLVIEQVQSIDLKRTFMFTLLGLVLVGPTLHFWYLFLSKLVTSAGASGALMRLVLDQLLFSPAFIGVFLATLVTLEGRPSQVVPKLQQEWFSSVIANWKLWIPFQFLNFRFVPQQFQVLAANVIALVWNVILSFKAHKEILPKDVGVGAACDK